VPAASNAFGSAGPPPDVPNHQDWRRDNTQPDGDAEGYPDGLREADGELCERQRERPEPDGDDEIADKRRGDFGVGDGRGSRKDCRPEASIAREEANGEQERGGKQEGRGCHRTLFACEEKNTSLERHGFYTAGVCPDMDLTRRPRRLRTDGIRPLVRETELSASDLIAPIFVDATTDERKPIESMPGHERVPISEAVARVEEIRETGVEAVIVFGIPESKDERGRRAWAEDGVVQEATRHITSETDAYVITDVCLCEYTSHGHCGVVEPGANEDPHLTVDNDETLDLLGKIAASHAEAGVEMVAPSGMIDGMVGAIRGRLDEKGHSDTAIMSYAAKYESAFYGPFRDAADGAPAFGDRRHYQMDPANAREATREVALDVEQGADVLMVKPALPYLDIVAGVRDQVDQPVAAYNVSGEYAMLHAAAEKGWLDLDSVAHESLLSIKRAGADLILTYFAEDVAERL